MRTVFTNSMCAHVWAQLSQPHGRSGSMKFDGAVAYSYQTPVAHIIKPLDRPAVALFVLNDWGVTTAAHLRQYRNAARQFPQFVVPEIFPHYEKRKIRDEAPDPALHAANVAYLIAQYNKERDALMRVPADSWRLGDDRAEARLTELSHTLHLYEDSFGLPHNGDVCQWLKDSQTIRERRDRLLNDPKRAEKRAKAAEARERAELAKAAKAAEARRVAALEAAEQLAMWQAGADVRLPWAAQRDNDGNAYLRVVGDNVETSQGAEAPVEHVRNALRFWRVLRAQGRAYDPNSDTGRASLEDVTLGHFRIDAIDAQGNVRAGCHNFSAAEVERLAELLGV